MTETVPKMTETAPEIIETVPDMNETVPKMTETVPEMADSVDGDISTAPEEDVDDYIEVDLHDAPDETGEVSGTQEEKPDTVKAGTSKWTCLCPYICIKRGRLGAARDSAEERSNGLDNNNKFGDDFTKDDNDTSAVKNERSRGRRKIGCSCCQNVCPFVCIKRTSKRIKRKDQDTEEDKKKPKTTAKWARPKLIRVTKPGKKPTESGTENHAYVNEAITADDGRPASPLDEVNHGENHYLDTADFDLEGGHEDEDEGMTTDIVPLEQAPEPPPEDAPTLDLETVSNASSESYLVVELPSA